MHLQSRKTDGNAREVAFVAEPSARLDEIDLGLIRLLREDGRRGNRELAQALGIAEGTVRARIRRLADSGVMRIVAIIDTEAAGYEFFLLLWMRVEGRPVKDVARELANLPQVLTVSIVTGTYDLFASLVARDKQDLLRLMAEEFGRIEGIVRIDSALTLDTVHATSDWGIFRE
jgi:Lrp/AsnC family transcriptional regulator for asnA, asnC and gidA